MDTKKYSPHNKPYIFIPNTKGMSSSLLNIKTNLRWDFHVPRDHILAEPSLTSTNHPHAIFQA